MNPRRWLAVLAFLAAAIPAGADTIQGVLSAPLNPTIRDHIWLTVVGTHHRECPVLWNTRPSVNRGTRTIRLVAEASDCTTPPPAEETFRQTFEIGTLPTTGTWYVQVGFAGLPFGAKHEILQVREPDPDPVLSLKGGGGDGGFQVVAEWRNHRDGSQGVGYSLPLAEDSGAFWFFKPDNLEATVKILDGRPVNGHFWVFIASMTDLEMKVTVYQNRDGCFDLPVFPPACPSKTYVQIGGQNRNFVDVNFSAE